jgi:ubiquinone biosynthesis protein
MTLLGSASIGQVHRARLHDGDQVVVKIRHQGIVERIKADLEILKYLAGLAAKHDAEIRQYQPVAILEEFGRVLRQEIDFRRELRNLEQFNSVFTHDERVHHTKVYPHFSSERILTMELLQGYSITHRERMLQEQVDLEEFARHGARIYMEMVFGEGFYHADPHPGNIWCMEGGRIGLLDWGMTGNLSAEMREDLEAMLMAVFNKDSA